MENSKRKFWAREILIFWVSLLVTVVVYLLFAAGASISDYFRNKEIEASNRQVKEAIVSEQAMIDSLMKVPQFIQNSVLNQECEEKRKKAFGYAFEKEAFTQSYLEFKSTYCCDESWQKKLYFFINEGFNNVGTFEKFQKEAFGDYLNPQWEENQKKIEQHKSKKRTLESEFRSDRKTHIHLELFALSWFVIVYPLRGIVFSILWAYRTLKEK